MEEGSQACSSLPLRVQKTSFQPLPLPRFRSRTALLLCPPRSLALRFRLLSLSFLF